MEALYFPRLSLPSSTWVNPNLLYFDRLSVIAPEGVRDLFDRRTQELIDLGMVTPRYPRGNWNHQDDDKFITFLLGKSESRRRGITFERVHAGKLIYTPIADALLSSGLLSAVDRDWLEGPDWIIGHLMAYLAAQVSSSTREPLPLITDERAALRLMAGPAEARILNRRIRAISRLLPVPPEVSPGELDRFRRRRKGELHAFRDLVNQLVARDGLDEQGELTFDRRVDEAEDLRDQLAGEMRSFGWRDGVTFSLGIAAAGAPLIEQSPWSFGASILSLVYGGTQSVAALRRSRRAAKSPLVYATRVVGRWQPTARQLLD